MIVHVVSALIIRNGRVFFTQRIHDKDYPFEWECPGGKVEPNETHHEALRRELNEELNWQVDLGGAPIRIAPISIFETEFEGNMSRPDRNHIKLFFYRVELEWDMHPVGREGQGSGWFTENVLPGLELAPGNEHALPIILQQLRASRKSST